MPKRPKALPLLLAPILWIAGCAHTREVYYPPRPAERPDAPRRAPAEQHADDLGRAGRNPTDPPETAV